MEQLKNQEEHGGSPENRLDITTGKRERSLTVDGPECQIE